jgi:hypothetical protein
MFFSKTVCCQDVCFDCLLKHKADSLFLKQKYYEAIRIYKQRQSQLYNNYYMIAVNFCQLDLKDSAEYYLQKAIENNFYYNDSFKYNKIENLNSDKNLPCLHNNSKLDSLLQKNYNKMNENIDENLRKEFLFREKLDQNVRHNVNIDTLSKFYNIAEYHIPEFIDSINMLFLDSVIQVIKKWPGIDIIGRDGDKSAWLFAQHADNFVEFQGKCYKYIEAASEYNNTALTNVAYLYDRIMINKGLKQRFATQIRIIDNKVVFIDLENDNEIYLDILRNCYRLSPLKDYKNGLENKFIEKNQQIRPE